MLLVNVVIHSTTSWGEEDPGARFFGIEIRVEHRVGFIKRAAVVMDAGRNFFRYLMARRNVLPESAMSSTSKIFFL